MADATVQEHRKADVRTLGRILPLGEASMILREDNR
jgi:hypothetical protein